MVSMESRQDRDFVWIGYTHPSIASVFVVFLKGLHSVFTRIAENDSLPYVVLP